MWGDKQNIKKKHRKESEFFHEVTAVPHFYTAVKLNYEWKRLQKNWSREYEVVKKFQRMYQIGQN
jgi:hypothetical protein